MLEHYIYCVRKEKSYVGGNGAIEDSLWKDINKAKNKLIAAKIPVPDYDSIESNFEDWS